jgi:hypothetical protein
LAAIWNRHTAPASGHRGTSGTAQARVNRATVLGVGLCHLGTACRPSWVPHRAPSRHRFRGQWICLPVRASVSAARSPDAQTL